MKKFTLKQISFLLSIVLAATFLPGCGDDENSEVFVSQVNPNQQFMFDVTTGDNGGGGGTPNPSPTPPPGPTVLPFEFFLYLPNESPRNVNSFLTLGIDDEGLATSLIPETSMNSEVLMMGTRVDGRILYSLGDTTIAAFSLQEGTGTPTQLGADLTLGGGANAPKTMALTPSTTGIIYVGVDNGSTNGVITAFRMQADGSLVAISDPSFPVAIPSGNDRFRVVLNPAGDQLYVPLALDGTVRRYQVENDGTLTFIDSVASGSARIWDLEFMPNLPFAYGSNVESRSLSIFSVANDGALTFLRNFSLDFGPTVTGNIRPFDLKAHPTLPILYGDNSTTSGSQDDTLAVYSVNQATGDLTLLEIERPGQGMSDLFMDPMAEYLYTTAGTDDLVSYSINADGTLENVETFELNPANNSNTFGAGREGATSTNTLLRYLDPNAGD